MTSDQNKRNVLPMDITKTTKTGTTKTATVAGTDYVHDEVILDLVAAHFGETWRGESRSLFGYDVQHYENSDTGDYAVVSLYTD